jgi:hypothetical protein
MCVCEMVYVVLLACMLNVYLPETIRPRTFGHLLPKVICVCVPVCLRVRMCVCVWVCVMLAFV